MKGKQHTKHDDGKRKSEKRIPQQTNILLIKAYLLENADAIQKEATRMHKKYLGKDSLRSSFLQQNETDHQKTIHEIARHLDTNNLDKTAAFFRTLGEQYGKKCLQDGLRIEEAINGTMYVKQAIFAKIKKDRLLNIVTVEEFYCLNQTIGTIIDTLASKIAFTYHNERQYVENNLQFLAEASKILSSSLDYLTTLQTVASLAVPRICDWCTIDILDRHGILQQMTVAHKDPRKIAWAKELRRAQPTDMNATTGVPNVLRTGKSELYPIITDAMLVASSKTKKELALARSIGFTSAMVVPIFSQNKPIGAITFVTTETNRHYNLADLLMAEELGTRASVAIENARLYKGSLEAINLRDDFISVASHELKTPVTSVKMFTQVLKKHSEQIGDVKAVGHLTKMDKQLNKLTELIYDLLNISKIQAGRMEFRWEKFNFDQMIKDIVEVLQQTTERHSLEIYGKTNTEIYGDEERIGQVVNNLLSNAVKYSPNADKIVVTLTADSENVTVSVQDFGIGMEKQHLERIFERFYRVYDTTDKTFPGLGIGLYISSEIIKRHGGKFWVDSDIGKGSIFYFSLPRDKK